MISRKKKDCYRRVNRKATDISRTASHAKLKDDRHAQTHKSSKRHTRRKRVFVLLACNGLHHLLLEKLLSLLVKEPILLLLRSIALEKYPIAPLPILLIVKLSALLLLRLLLRLLRSFFGISTLVEMPRAHRRMPVHHVVARGLPAIGGIVGHKAIGLKVGIAQMPSIGSHLLHRGRIEIDRSAQKVSSHTGTLAPQGKSCRRFRLLRLPFTSSIARFCEKI